MYMGICNVEKYALSFLSKVSLFHFNMLYLGLGGLAEAGKKVLL